MKEDLKCAPLELLAERLFINVWPLTEMEKGRTSHVVFMKIRALNWGSTGSAGAFLLDAQFFLQGGSDPGQYRIMLRHQSLQPEAAWDVENV